MHFAIYTDHGSGPVQQATVQFAQVGPEKVLLTDSDFDTHSALATEVVSRVGLMHFDQGVPATEMAEEMEEQLTAMLVGEPSTTDCKVKVQPL